MQRSPYLLPVLLACASLTVMAGATIAPGLPGLVAHFADYPDADYLSRFILTAPGLAIACSASFAGLMADKLGRRVLLQAGIGLYIVSGSAGLWLDDLILLLVSRFVLGLAVGMIMVCSMALLTDHFQGAERERAMGIQSSAMSMGGIVFISSGAILADLSWRAPFGVYLLPCVLLPLVYFFVKKPPSGGEESGATTGRFPFAHAALLYPLACLSMLMFYFIPTQLPFLALELGADSLKYAGFAIALSQLFATVASANYHRLRARFDNTQILMISYGCMSAGFLLLSTADSLTLIYLCMPLIGVGLGFNFPNLTIWMMSKVPSTMRGRSSGGLTTAVFIGQFLSPILSQPVVNTYDLASAFRLAGTVMVALVVLPCIAVKVMQKFRTVDNI
ncbi:MAG: MFS transporter [Granulosicoccus sp.]